MPNSLFSLGRRLIERGAWFLAPASWVWGAVVLIRNFLYDQGCFRSARVPAVVVSIGNIVVGGTGKTPFVLMAAAAFSSRKVAILSRGYGAIPDEALLLQKRLPNVSVYIGKDRSKLASVAASRGAELIFLDDGFQHRQLARDFDIVLGRKEDPLGKGHYLPWGFLRDSPQRLQKADAVFFQGQDFVHRAKRVIDFSGQEISIKGKAVAVFCGIAYPESFVRTVSSLGANIVARWFLADHQPASDRKLGRFAKNAQTRGAEFLITTEKDAVKGPVASLPIVFVESELEWLRGRGKWEKLFAKINHAIDNNPHQRGRSNDGKFNKN